MPIQHLNGLRHHFRLEGSPSRPPLALLHPIGADHGIFDKVVPALLERFCILRPDLRGHGGTEVPGQDCTIADLSGDLLGLTEALGWGRFAVCGISLGGMTALHAAIVAPERICALALCSAAAAMSPPPGGWQQRAAQAVADGMASLAGPMVQRMVSADHLATGDPHVATLRTTFERMDPHGYARCVAVLRDSDLRPQLGLVRAPTCILHGARDPLIMAEKLQVLAEGIPSASLRSLDCGHFPPLELPAQFVQALAETMAAA